MFDDDFIKGLPEDKTKAIIVLCKKVLAFHASVQYPMRHYKSYMKALGFLQAYADSTGESINFPEVGIKREENILHVVSLFTRTSETYEKRLQQEALEAIKKEYTEKLKSGEDFLYSFTNSEMLSIKKKIVDLRAIILRNNFLDKDYKSRLVNRLDRLQALPYNALDSLDIFWGLVAEKSTLQAILGNEGKHIIDGIYDIAKAVWQIQLKREGLPETTPYKP